MYMKLQNDAKRGGLGVLKDRTKALEIASRLRRMRIEAGYSQRELAEAADVNVSSVISAESATHMPRPTTLRKLAEAFDVDVSDFFDATLISKELESWSESIAHALMDQYRATKAEEKRRRETNPPRVDTVTPHEEAREEPREEPREREPVRKFSTTNLESMSTEEFEELQNLVALERARRYWVASQES